MWLPAYGTGGNEITNPLYGLPFISNLLGSVVWIHRRTDMGQKTKQAPSDS